MISTTLIVAAALTTLTQVVLIYVNSIKKKPKNIKADKFLTTLILILLIFALVALITQPQLI